MTRQVINIGTNANDGTGDPLRTAFDKINDNFLELYGADSDATTFDNPTLVGALMTADLDLNGNKIISASNGNITLDPQGTGTIELTANTNITGAATVSSTLNVTGLSTLASLKLASGATATELSIDGTFAGNSDTAIPTEKAVKTYVDSQVTAQDLDFQGDTGGALAVDLDSQTFTIAGGTGIDTAGSGQTLTVNIDSSVVTLTGSQVLTGKTLTTPTINGATMTGPVTVDNITINDTDITTSSNANLVLNPGGTGTVELQANTNVTGTATVSGLLTASASATVVGTLTTQDITTVGNQTISGYLTTGSLNIGDLNIDSQGRITTDTNGDVDVVPSGTGAINLTGPTNITGVGTVTGELSIDNININGNTISSTSGGITLNAANGTVQATSIFEAGEMHAILAEITTLRTDKIQSDTSNADILIDTQGTGVVDFRTATQSSVCAATGATALPGNPVGFLKFKLNGTDIVVPYWNAS